jgi:hypothetical protein
MAFYTIKNPRNSATENLNYRTAQPDSNRQLPQKRDAGHLVTLKLSRSTTQMQTKSGDFFAMKEEKSILILKSLSYLPK